MYSGSITTSVEYVTECMPGEEQATSFLRVPMRVQSSGESTVLCAGALCCSLLSASLTSSWVSCSISFYVASTVHRWRRHCMHMTLCPCADSFSTLASKDTVDFLCVHLQQYHTRRPAGLPDERCYNKAVTIKRTRYVKAPSRLFTAVEGCCRLVLLSILARFSFWRLAAQLVHWQSRVLLIAGCRRSASACAVHQ